MARFRVRGALQLASWLALATVARDASAQSWKPDRERNPSPTPAQLAEAKERYEKGVKLYEDEGSVQAALIEFERAYDLAPNYKVLYNVGQAARTLREYASALRAFEAYLEGGKEKIPKQRAAEVERDVAQLRTYVATVTVQVDTDGAQIAIDNVAIGVSPLAQPILVNAGRSTLTATKAGRVGALSLTLAGGDVQTARLQVPMAETRTEDRQRAEAAASAPAPTTVVSASPSTQAHAAPDRTGVYLAFGVGSAFAVGAGITGYAALRTSNDLTRERFAGPRPSAEAESLRSRTRRLSLTSDVLLGATVASAAVGIVLLAIEPSRPAPGVALASPRLRPLLTATSAGLEGSF